MGSPVPKHLRTEKEIATIPARFVDHVSDLRVSPKRVTSVKAHPAKYAPGLPTELYRIAGTNSLGDPFAGTGRLAEELQLPSIALNEIDPRWKPELDRLKERLGVEVSIGDAREIERSREAMVFSPPYYPRTDRRRLAGTTRDVVGYRTGYGGYGIPGFIGDPEGSDSILLYRNAMREVFAHLKTKAGKMLIVVKNTMRLGVELRLDLDTTLTA